MSLMKFLEKWSQVVEYGSTTRVLSTEGVKGCQTLPRLHCSPLLGCAC